MNLRVLSQPCRFAHFAAWLTVTFVSTVYTAAQDGTERQHGNARQNNTAQPLKAGQSGEIDYGPAINQLAAVIASELDREILTGVSVALIDGQQVVLTSGFGWADKQRQVPATAETVYRVGSISKLFTALAAMQLVEQGKLDLDAPLSKILPGFRIVDPFANAQPVTLRQLMCHRSGLVRESPVGGYLDDSEASIAESIASLKACVLVNPPGTRTRYSNIGVTVVGQAVAAASGLSYEQYQQTALMKPLGMTHSSWSVDDIIRGQLATGYMRVAKNEGGFYRRPAPPFELGTIPAGNFYSSVNDMALFSKMLLAEGALADGRIVHPDTLAHMSTPQLTDDDTGFGLGFFAGTFGKYRTIRHTGAVYGFSTSIVVIPTAQIAVVVLTNEDIAAGPVKHISESAIDLMLAAKTGEPIRKWPPTLPKSVDQLAPFTGQFESDTHWAEITLEGDALTLDIAGQPMTVRSIGPLSFEIDGRFVYRDTLEFQHDAKHQMVSFKALGQTFTRQTSDSTPTPARWNQYLGSYGPEFIPLVISIRHGHLYAMTENMVDYRLTPINATVFKMPEGLYADEYLVFEIDTKGEVHAATLANMTLRRRP